MPRNRFSLPITHDIAQLCVAINEQFDAISSQLAQIEGLDSETPSFASDVNFNSHRLTNVQDPQEDTDAVTLGYLRQAGFSEGTGKQTVVYSGGGGGGGGTTINPTFSNVTASRVLGTVYQNTSGTAIVVQISVTLAA